MLTKQDLKLIGEVVDLKLQTTLETTLDKKFDEKLGKYPNKDEFYEETLRVLKKLDDIEVQMKMLSGRTYDNTDRIELLEKLHPDGKHQNFLQI